MYRYDQQIIAFVGFYVVYFIVVTCIIIGYKMPINLLSISYVVGIVIGVVAGCLVKRKYKRVQREIYNRDLKLFEDEELLVDGMALFNNQIGWLYLVNERLLFIFRDCLYQEHSIYLEDVCKVIVTNQIPFMYRCVLIETSENRYEYEVDYPKDWQSLILFHKDILPTINAQSNSKK